MLGDGERARKAACRLPRPCPAPIAQCRSPANKCASRESTLPPPKDWLAGPWDSRLAVSVGYATAGVDEPHLHTEITEIYLVARGASQLRVEQTTVELSAGDAVIIEPGEAHTFLWSSSEYLHFVIHTPGLAGRHAQSEKVAVLRSRLGL